MKTTSHLAAVSAAVLTICALAPNRAVAQAQTPSIPVGSLDAYPTVVQTGTKPTLTWSITHPTIITSFVDITAPPNGTITPKTTLTMDVRVLGAQVGTSTEWYKVQAEVKAEGSSSFLKFFDAKQSAVNPTQKYYTRTVTQNKAITFRGRVASSSSNSPSSWQAWYQTGLSTGNNVRALVNGDTPPNYVPAFNNQSTIKSAIGPYIQNGKINIGPMDVIIIYELWGTATNQSYFDMQDLILLVTFTKN
jgi:hypothetical protein